MTYLLDANVWLEALLGRAHSGDAEQLVRIAPPGTLAVTDFALHAIGLFVHSDQSELFRSFLDDLIRRQVNTLHLPASSLYNVLDFIALYALDFDDAFQYVAAERYDLKIVSFDRHFDRTPRGRITPAQALSEIQQRSQP